MSGLHPGPPKPHCPSWSTFTAGLACELCAEALYDGVELAKKGLVVVTLNYQLESSASLPTQNLPRNLLTTPRAITVARSKRSAAMVHRNIAAFSGDPDKVTIFGQSSGAFSVNAQVASPLSKGLFRAGSPRAAELGLDSRGQIWRRCKMPKRPGFSLQNRSVRIRWLTYGHCRRKSCCKRMECHRRMSMDGFSPPAQSPYLRMENRIR